MLKPPHNLRFKEAIEQISDAYSVNKNLSKTAQTNVEMLRLWRVHVQQYILESEREETMRGRSIPIV